MIVSVAAVGSASGAAVYYAKDNYYTAEQSAELSEWGGEAAARLGLLGKVDAQVFEQVLAGKLPNGVAISGGSGEHVAGTQAERVELARGNDRFGLTPRTLSSNGKGAALTSPAEIEVRAGDRLVWTTNNRQLGIANGNPVDVLRIGRDGITLRDATAIRTLAPGNPLRESLAHSLVLNMHRAQGLTVDRAITVMDSHDRLLNSKSLFYVLSSRAREHLGLHVDSKERLADAVGRHRGDVPHARDVAREADKIAESGRDKPAKDRSSEQDKSPKPEIEMEISKTMSKAFDFGH